MERRKNGLNICPELFRILKYLTGTVSSAVGAFSQTLPDGGSYLSEIRLRAGAPVSVTYLDRNVCLFDGKPIVCSESEVAGTLQRLCEDSVHTYGETIKEGFVALENGYRIGVVGRAGSEKENIKSVYGISSLSIRIPHSVSGFAVCMGSWKNQRNAFLFSAECGKNDADSGYREVFILW